MYISNVLPVSQVQESPQSYYGDNREGTLLSFGYFAHCPGSLSTLLDWVGSPLCGTFTICTMHCPFAV